MEPNLVENDIKLSKEAVPQRSKENLASHSPSTEDKESKGTTEEIANTLTKMRNYLQTGDGDSERVLPYASTSDTSLSIEERSSTCKTTSSKQSPDLDTKQQNGQLATPYRYRPPWATEFENARSSKTSSSSDSSSTSSRISIYVKNLDEPFKRVQQSREGQKIDGNKIQSKESVIDRFHKFLERNRKPPPHSGIKVCVKPVVAPEIMAEIEAAYDRHNLEENCRDKDESTNNKNFDKGFSPVTLMQPNASNFEMGTQSTQASWSSPNALWENPNIAPRQYQPANHRRSKFAPETFSYPNYDQGYLQVTYHYPNDPNNVKSPTQIKCRRDSE